MAKKGTCSSTTTKRLEDNVAFRIKEKHPVLYMYYRKLLLEIPMFLSFSAIPSDRIKVSKELLIWMVFIWSAAVMEMMSSMIPNPLEQPTKSTKHSWFWTSRMTFRQHPRHDNIMDCSGKSRFDRPTKHHPSLD